MNTKKISWKSCSISVSVNSSASLGQFPRPCAGKFFCLATRAALLCGNNEIFYECVVATMLPQIPVQATHENSQCARLIFFMGFHFPCAKQKSYKQTVQFRDWDFFNFSKLLTTAMQKLSELTYVTVFFSFLWTHFHGCQ